MEAYASTARSHLVIRMLSRKETKHITLFLIIEKIIMMPNISWIEEEIGFYS